MNEERKNKPSSAWYLLPIILGFIGGIIGYLAVRDRDKEMAKRLLIIGFVVSFLVYGVILMLGAGLYAMGVFSPQIPNTCTGFSYFAFSEQQLKEDGTYTIVVLNNNQDIKITGISLGGQELATTERDVSAGQKVMITGTGSPLIKVAGDAFSYDVAIRYDTTTITGKTDMAICSGIVQ